MTEKYSIKPCPRCPLGTMEPIGERTGGFSGGKAALGVVALGPIGIVAGALGKKKITYKCKSCGYTTEV